VRNIAIALNVSQGTASVTICAPLTAKPITQSAPLMMIAVSCNDEHRVLSANATFSERPCASSVVVSGTHTRIIFSDAPGAACSVAAKWIRQRVFSIRTPATGCKRYFAIMPNRITICSRASGLVTGSTEVRVGATGPDMFRAATTSNARNQSHQASSASRAICGGIS